VANILVIGASRGTGLEAVKRALECGHAVRAFSRGADRIPIDNANLEKRRGDTLDEKDVGSALDGIDAVIQALGIAAGPDLILGPVRLFSEATRILLPAMETAGARVSAPATAAPTWGVFSESRSACSSVVRTTTSPCRNG